MHFYDHNGSPCYEIKGKNGNMRTPYIREAKALKLVPGSTSVSSQIGSDSIVEWKVSMAIEICRQNPFCEMGSSVETWQAKIRNLVKKESDRITNQGKYIHDALEKYYKTGKVNLKYDQYIFPVIELIERTWPHLYRTDWIAEKRFNYKGLYGGSVDLHTEYGDGIVLDFKTKDTIDVKKFKAYEGHKQQLISYSYGLNIPKAECGNIFLSALKPNIVTLEMHNNLNIYWEKFKLLLRYWHLENYNQHIEV